MKITQEVRDFATRQNQEADAFLAANPPRDGEGDHSAPPNGGGDDARTAPLTGAEAAAASKAAALKGMEKMAAKFRATGSELYMGAGGRERD